MSKITTRILMSFVLLLSVTTLRAQSISVANEADLLAAINTLNTSGVASGGATITFTANVSLTAALPAIGSAALNATTSAANPLVINGASYTLTANYAGIRAGSITTGANDAVFAIAGTDYVTIQNLTFAEQASNNASASAIENAIGFYNLSVTSPFDGCQNETVNACTFNMNKNALVNFATTVYGTNSTYGGTAVLAWATYATDPTQMHRVISLTGNTFNGSYNHSIFNGRAGTNSRELTITGNTFNNYGGGSGIAYAIYNTNYDTFVFDNNTFNGASTSQTGTSYAIFNGTSCGGQQSASNNSVTLQSGVTTGTTYGIYMPGIGLGCNINNNTLTIGAFPAITTGTLYGFYASNSGGVTGQTNSISNNTVTGQTWPATSGSTYLFYNQASSTAGTNSVCLTNNNTATNITKTGGGSFYCVYHFTAINVTATGNVISDISINNTTVSGTSSFYGMYISTSATNLNVYNNTIKNIAVSGTSTSTSGTMYCLFATASTNNNVYDNLIENNGYTGTTSGTIYGLYVGGANTNAYRNIVKNLSAANLGTIYGIFSSSGASVKIYNNQVSGLSNPTGNSGTALYGAYFSGTTTNVDFTHNTIYIGEGTPLSSTGLNYGVAGVYYINTIASLNLKNNIINVQAIPNGTGTVSVLKRSAIGTIGVKPTNFNPSYNIYYTNSGANNYIYSEGTTNTSVINGYAVSGLTANPTNNIVNDPGFNTACGAYKSFMLDAGTFEENNLVSVGSYYAPTGASFAEASATTSTTPAITDDISSTSRAATPDMGALEFAGSATDATAPIITFSDMSSTICTTDPTLSVAITDLSGIQTTSGTAPRLWYKKSTEANALVGNTSADNGWKYVEASNTTSPFQFTMNLSLLNSAPAGADVIQYFVAAQDMAPIPNVASKVVTFAAGYCPTSVALDIAAFPTSGTIKSFTFLPDPVTVTTVASKTELCVTGNVNFSLTGDASTGAFYQWQSSPAGTNTWTDIVGANSITYAATGITSSTDYRCEISCEELVANGGTPITINNSAQVTVNVTTPTVLTTSPASRCGVGTVTLGATASGTGTLNWYTAPTGGLPLGTGVTFTTPSIASTTDFYVSASEGGLSGLTIPGDGAWNHFTTAGSFQSTTITGAYMILDVLAPMTLTSMDIYPSAIVGTNFTIEARTGSASGPMAFSYATATTVQNSGTPTVAQTLPVNWVLPVGTYYIGFINNPSTWRSGLATHSFPWVLPGVASLNYYLTPSYQYYFYNLNISTGCESARTPVTASVVPPPAISIIGGGASNAECSTTVIPLSQSSTLGDFDNYVWTPNTYLYTDAAATIPYTGTSEQNVYAKGAPAGTTTYTLTASNSTTGCVNTATAPVTYLPGTLNVQGNADLCVSGSSTLSYAPTTSITSTNIQWNDASGAVSGSNGATYVTPVITSSTYYSVTLKDYNGNTCLTTSNYTVNVNNPTITGSVPATRCGTGTVTLSATPSAGSSVQWFSTPTGGSPIINAYSSIPVTGFNNDIVANGVGSNTIEGMTNATIGVDGAGYCFIDNTFKYAAASALPTCFMPTSNSGVSVITPGLNYTFQGYGAAGSNNNNALTVVNQSSPYTSPYPNSASFNLATPGSYANLNVLYEAVVNVAPMTVDVVVTFTDATTQTFAGNACVNWFSTGGAAFSGMGRTTPTGAIQCGATPNMFELNLPISLSNQSKLVQSVNFTLPTVLTGANPYNVNYFHALDLNGIKANSSGTFTTPSISSTTTYYAQATSPGGLASGGRPDVTTGGNGNVAGYGVILTANNAMNIDSIGVMATGPATIMTCRLYDVTGNNAVSAPFNINIPANAGTATTPVLIKSAVNVNIPQAGTYRLVHQASTVSGSLRYDFTNVTGYPFSVGPDLTIDGGITGVTGAINLAYYPYFWYLTVRSVCGSSPRTPVVATVTTAPAITVSASTDICQTQSTVLDVTSPNTNYDYTWEPGTLSGASQTVSPSANTTYTVSALDPSTGCETSDVTTITVNQNPTPVILSNATPAGCPGTISSLTATGGTIGGLYQLGTGATVTSVSGITPYTSFYESQRIQYLMTAAELTALGMVGGNISSLAFNVTSVPTLTTIYPQVGYTIKMAQTANTNLTGAYATPTGSFTTVYGPSTQGQPSLGWNTYNFSTPFTWDGVSNVVIDICHETDPTSICTNCYMTSATVQYTATTYNSVYGRYQDNAAACGLLPTGIATSGLTFRPNIKFNSATPTSLTWSPAASLYTDASATTGYTGTAASNLFAMPGATTTYTVTATSVDGCTAEATITDTILSCNSTVNLTCFLECYVDQTLSPVVAMRPSCFNNSVCTNANDVDNIIVSLHTAPPALTQVASVTTVLSTDGTATATFPPLSGSYYIKVQSTNHITTWSAGPVAISGVPVSYNFSTATTQAAGGNMIAIPSSSLFAFFGGDFDHNGGVDNDDYALWEADANDFVLNMSTDADGNGGVDNDDYPCWEINAGNFVSEVAP